MVCPPLRSQQSMRRRWDSQRALSGPVSLEARRPPEGGSALWLLPPGRRSHLGREKTIGGVLRGNTIRGNRPERFWEGSASERVSERTSERYGFRAFQRFSEVFRDFQKFSEVFQRPSQRPSQSAIFLSELRVVLPLIVLPLKTPAKPISIKKFGRTHPLLDRNHTKTCPCGRVPSVPRTSYPIYVELHKQGCDIPYFWGTRPQTVPGHFRYQPPNSFMRSLFIGFCFSPEIAFGTNILPT